MFYRATINFLNDLHGSARRESRVKSTLCQKKRALISVTVGVGEPQTLGRKNGFAGGQSVDDGLRSGAIKTNSYVNVFTGESYVVWL